MLQLELLVLLAELVVRQVENLFEPQVWAQQNVAPLSPWVNGRLFSLHREQLLLGLDHNEAEASGCVHVLRVRGLRPCGDLTERVLQIAENQAPVIQLGLEDPLDEVDSGTSQGWGKGRRVRKAVRGRQKRSPSRLASAYLSMHSESSSFMANLWMSPFRSVLPEKMMPTYTCGGNKANSMTSSACTFPACTQAPCTQLVTHPALLDELQKREQAGPHGRPRRHGREPLILAA